MSEKLTEMGFPVEHAERFVTNFDDGSVTVRRASRDNLLRAQGEDRVAARFVEGDLSDDLSAEFKRCLDSE